MSNPLPPLRPVEPGTVIVLPDGRQVNADALPSLLDAASLVSRAADEVRNALYGAGIACPASVMLAAERCRNAVSEVTVPGGSTNVWSFQLVQEPLPTGNAPEDPDDPDDRSVRTGHCRIAGRDFHITAIPVEGSGRSQRALDGSDLYGFLRRFEDVTTGFRTITLDGAPYVVVLTPYCA